MIVFWRTAMAVDVTVGRGVVLTSDCADGLAQGGCVFFDGALGAQVARLAPDMHLIKVAVK